MLYLGFAVGAVTVALAQTFWPPHDIWGDALGAIACAVIGAWFNRRI